MPFDEHNHDHGGGGSGDHDPKVINIVARAAFDVALKRIAEAEAVACPACVTQVLATNLIAFYLDSVKETYGDQAVTTVLARMIMAILDAIEPNSK